MEQLESLAKEIGNSHAYVFTFLVLSGQGALAAAYGTFRTR